MLYTLITPKDILPIVMNDQWTPMTAAGYIRLVAAQAQEEINNTVILMEGMLLARTDPETGEWEMNP